MAVKKQAVAKRKTAPAKKPTPRDTIVSIQRATSEAIKRQKAQIESRAAATKKILTPDDVKGDYDATRTLQTTFGEGILRDITVGDLAAFRRNVETIGKKYKGGITAKAIISRSAAVDRQRANAQIRQAIPARAKKGRIDFVTNAGPDSEKIRHFVSVELMAYPASVSSTASAAYLAKKISQDTVKTTCDCGRWVYWYSYLSTIGGYNCGPIQTGFPKIRNPGLSGLACKHVLRVMQQLETAPVVRVIAKMIDTDRAAAESGKAKAVTMTAKQAAEFAARQVKEAGLKRNRITPIGAKRAAERVKKALQTKILKREAASKNTPAKDLADARRKLDDLYAVGVLTRRAYEAALKRINKGIG